jgi:hypothetical protein
MRDTILEGFERFLGQPAVKDFSLDLQACDDGPEKRNVLVTIEKREAIPVRALPFVLKWNHPMTVARELVRIGDKEFLEHPQYAYTWDERGTVALVLPRYWQALVATHERQPLKALSPVERLRRLPPAVFMWRKGFEKAFNQVLTGYPTPNLALRPSGFVFAYDLKAGDELWNAIMEGFDRHAAQAITVAQESALSTVAPARDSLHPDPVREPEVEPSGTLLEQRVERLRKWLASMEIPAEQWRSLGSLDYSLSSVYEELKNFPEFRSNSGRGEPITAGTFERKFWKEQKTAKISDDG